jgi:hypothetical protein
VRNIPINNGEFELQQTLLTDGAFTIYGLSMSTAKTILADIKAFCAKHSIEPTRFGLASVHDGHLVRNLERYVAGEPDGKGMHIAKLDRIREFMASYESHNIPRPKRRKHKQEATAA